MPIIARDPMLCPDCRERRRWCLCGAEVCGCEDDHDCFYDDFPSPYPDD